MSLVMPYLLPLMLGRTYDQRTSQPGVDIFAPDVITQHTKVTATDVFKSTFRIISSSEDVRKLMDVSGEFSLNALSGKIDVKGSGSYLKETRDREKEVEILCRAYYETETTTLEVTSETKPTVGWDQYNPSVLGSHYVNSIKYGGELVASLKFKTNDNEAAKQIKAEIEGSLNVEGTFDGTVKAKLQDFSKNTKTEYKIEVSYYATTAVEGVPQTIDGLIALIDGFQDATKNVHGGKGNPIQMVLLPLTQLSGGNNLPTFVANQAVIANLDDFREKYEDLLLTRRVFKDWVKKMTTLLSQDEKSLTDFYTKVGDILEVFYEKAYDLDVTQPPSQLDPAFTAYEAGGVNIPMKYYRQFRTLQKEILRHNMGSCFTSALANELIFKSNLVSDGTSVRAIHATTVDDCKVECILAEKCGSVTFAVVYDADSQQETQRCFVNEAVDPTVAVPKGGQGVYVYKVDRNNCSV